MNKELINTVRQILSDYLEKNGLRKTPERFAILEEIYNYDGHFEIEKLYITMRNKNISISRATLYNTIEVLLAAKIIKKHQFGGNVKHYEKALVNTQHDHIICVICGKVQEFSDARVTDIRLSIAESFQFKVSHHSMYIYGTCSECFGKMKPKTD
ncbi:MAG TPA: transcriptional repressor [Bacteroidales bacterium]|nr:transcriptional repressor [Bacteroidales bacterium]